MNDQDLVAQVAGALVARLPLPALQTKLSLEQAYELQHAVTRLRCPDDWGGIKAGVTAPGAQQFFGVDQALIASLYGDGRQSDGCQLPFIKGRMLECELAVIVDADGNPQAIAPAIEIVLVQFSRPEDMTASNLVLSNLGADGYILGDFRDWSPPYDDFAIRLSCSGEVINQAQISDSLGGPESAVPWIVREATARGFSLGEGTLLLTGACGKVVPAEAGDYSADFGTLGSISFEILAGKS
jgi:2-keto-4-pentenoate hydratase